jgi:chromosome segregation ATPase
VVQAKTKLTRILSQEESVGKLLEQAQQTLNYWREQYEKYQEKKQLQLKRRFLGRELVWAEVERRETTIKELQVKFNKNQQAMGRLEDERQALIGELDNQLTHQQTLKGKAKAVFEQRLSLEREVAQNESILSFIEQFLSEAQTIEALANRSQFKLLRIENLEKMLDASRQQIEKATEEINETQKIMLKMDVSSDKISSESLEKRVSLALLEYKKANAIADMKTIEKQLREAEESLNNAILKAQQSGERIAVIKSNAEIQDEIGLTNGHLSALSEVSEDIELQYESYSKLYLELKEKAQLVAENREKTLQEVQTRMLSWRTVMENLLERVNVEYQKIMSQTLATGEVKLSAAQDIETAGLEIYVGFKGSKPVALDAYTQSGGERTTATMGFLLALQQHVRSPFRAVDEYDIHMDPKNREMIAKVLVAMIKDASAQYVVITPSQITFAQHDANVITVQNLEGKSVVREVA